MNKFSPWKQFQKDLLKDEDYQNKKTVEVITPWYSHYENAKDKTIIAAANKVVAKIPNKCHVKAGHLLEEISFY